MGFIEVFLTGTALSLDACAVGMTHGMTNPKMKLKRVLLIAVFFGVFQALMPLIGYFITGIMVDAFREKFDEATFKMITSCISFILLAFLGGKMIWDFIKGCTCKETQTEEGETVLVCECPTQKFSIGKLFIQAIATSIDALAIGVVMQLEGVALGIWLSVLMIGITTFALCIGAVYIGKKIGDKLADKAGLFGGIVLVAIGIKLLLEGILAISGVL